MYKLLKLFFDSECPNICNVYYSQKELKYFGLKMLVVNNILGHFEL